MMRGSISLALLTLVGLTTACGAPDAPANASTLSLSTPITAGMQAPGVPSGPFLADGQRSGDLSVWMASSPTPPTRGDVRLATFVRDTNGSPINGAIVTYDLDMTNMSHGSYVVRADAASDGQYMGLVHLSMSGPWRVVTTIEFEDQPAIRLRFEFRVHDS